MNGSVPRNRIFLPFRFAQALGRVAPNSLLNHRPLREPIQRHRLFAPESASRLHLHLIPLRRCSNSSQSHFLDSEKLYARGIVPNTVKAMRVPILAVSMQSRRTLTLTLSLLRRERGTFGGSVSESPNRDPRQVRSSSPLPARSGDQGEGRFRLHSYG